MTREDDKIKEYFRMILKSPVLDLWNQLSKSDGQQKNRKEVPPDGWKDQSIKQFFQRLAKKKLLKNMFECAKTKRRREKQTQREAAHLFCRSAE